MPAKKKVPIGDAFLVLEVCFRPGEDVKKLCVVASIPDREGTLVGRWEFGGFLPDQAVITDLNAWMSRLVNEAVWVRLGVQQVLPLR